MLRSIFYTVVMFVLLFDAHAGEFGYAKDASNRLYITYEGRIETGDADKFRQLLLRDKYNFLHASGLIVNSPGGSMDEALNLAELVESSGLRVDVSENGICASSCFLVYVSAPVRFSTAPVIIHRPYYDMERAVGSDGPTYERAYRDAFAHTRAYLSDRLVPNYLIDVLMTKGSAQGYTLTPRDIAAVGVMSPAVSEYSQQLCGLPQDRLATTQELDSARACIDEYLFHARFNFLYGARGPAARNRFLELGAYTGSLRRLDPGCYERLGEYSQELRKIVDSQPPDNWLLFAEKICPNLP